MHERVVKFAEVIEAVSSGKLLEAFGVGTAVVVAAIGAIGYEGKDIELQKYVDGHNNLGPIGSAIFESITAIQRGEIEWQGWSVVVQ